LIKHKDNSDVVKALIASARDDDFWAVRQSAVDTLGQMKREEDIAFFKEKCSDEKSSVRAAALSALGEFEKIEFVPFLRERFQEDDSYLAQAEALRSIVKCGDSSQIPFLEEAAQMTSNRSVIKRAAEAAIKAIRGRSSR
jgi:aminopeptidase N